MKEEHLPKDIDYELLARYLSGEVSGEERDHVDVWIRRSEENAAFFASVKTLWEEATPDHFDEDVPAFTVDTDAAWSKVQKRITPEVSEPRVIRFRPWLRIAAVLVSLLMVTFIVYRFGMEPSQQSLVAEGGKEEVKLVDGSVIELNEHAKITYPKEFKDGQRKVALEGEAFFEIEPDKTKPFVVETDGLEIKVLGTSFNVNAAASEDSIEVQVETGVVQIENEAGSLTLVAGETGVYLVKENKLFKRNLNVVTSQFWRNRKLNFRRTPLRDVVLTLNKLYDVDIRLKGGDIDTSEISVRFEDEDIDMILDIIANTLQLEVENKDGRKIILKPTNE